jgi:hypothetical protein
MNTANGLRGSNLGPVLHELFPGNSLYLGG